MTGSDPAVKPNDLDSNASYVLCREYLLVV